MRSPCTIANPFCQILRFTLIYLKLRKSKRKVAIIMDKQESGGEFLDNKEIILLFLLGFGLSYLFFFVRCVFFDNSGEMLFFKYIPAVNPIGIDLKTTLSFSAPWFSNDPSASYTGCSFPPLSQLFFLPFLLLDFNITYKLWFAISLISYVLITFVFPYRISDKKEISPVFVLLFISGIISYGFQFELERGQFNVFTIFLVVLAISLFHYSKKLKWLSYFIFAASVNFKIYPAIFVFMFVKDIRKWKENLLRFTGLGLLSFILLFVTGWSNAIEYLNHIKGMLGPPVAWWTNHSIQGFLTWIPDKLECFPTSVDIRNTPMLNIFPDTASFIREYTTGLTWVLFGLFIIGLMAVLYHMWKNNIGSINPYLPLVCTILCLVIPSQSQDYKLSILTWALVVFITTVRVPARPMFKGTFLKILLVTISFFYSTLLYSQDYKPWFLDNNFIVIFFLFLSLISFLILNEGLFKLKKPLTRQ